MRLVKRAILFSPERYNDNEILICLQEQKEASVK